MKLSIIVPFYNVEEYIVDCLNSIYDEKKLKDFEVICVDDCGKDKTSDIIRDFVKKNKINNLSIIKHEKNGGLSAARNTGLKKAKGKYVCFLDSDDMINAAGLEKLVDESLINDLDIAEGNYSEFFETNQNISVEDTMKDKIDDTFVYSGEDFFEIVSKDFTPMVWRRIYKTKFLLDNNLYFYEGLKFEDEEFSPRAILKAKKIMHLNHDIYYYRRRDNSITTTMTKNNDWVNHYLTIVDSLTTFSKSLNNKSKRNLDNRIAQIVLSFYKNPISYGCNDENLNEIIKIVKDKKMYKIPRKSSRLFIKIQGFLMKYPKLFFSLYGIRGKRG